MILYFHIIGHYWHSCYEYELELVFTFIERHHFNSPTFDLILFEG